VVGTVRTKHEQLKTLTPAEPGFGSFRIALKDEVRISEISQKLSHFGYKNLGRVQVVEPGEFSFRGGLLDIWLERYKIPVRLDLIGERVEGIYLFNPLTHEKVRNLKEVFIIPLRSLPDLSKTWKKQGEKNYEKIFLSEIKEGDYVVHIDNGIGRFLGFRNQNENTQLVVEYARGDRLYVPLQQIERLTKYIGTGGRRVILNSLGTAAWEKTKERVADEVVTVAKDLLLLYAQRERVKRKPYPADSLWQKELENSFEFQETQDQLKALEEIKKDLQNNRPMDRLLVGDVGFGKTEIAIRAAFKVAENGKQVAVLVPTTILAEQHFHIFRERLSRFPIKVSLLSRFTEAPTEKQIINDVKNGAIDILIGTHRILSKDVLFSSLGLLIIDEEHKFGVEQKEKLKKLRTEVDVLSLSATPIPRSLYMSLAKIRDISILSSAPLGRLPIKTIVKEFDKNQIKEAIGLEMGRKGQTFYLSNRISTLQAKAGLISELVPSAKVGIAHGKMNEKSLEKTMESFYSGELDVLVCTTLIGSGLDIPNVNTIIIENAQKFGLSDLYQLRGRVGRGEREAFAYLFFPKGYKPEGSAAERLLAISQATEIGSGFKIASRDLEIRGAGNLLGTKQSGNIALVGFELYLQLLAHAVEELSKF
jgi:transcription-repair coupling factor (superfamily II helicase)